MSQVAKESDQEIIKIFLKTKVIFQNLYGASVHDEIPVFALVSAKFAV